ncbi:MAG: TetR/AcrR family transcriptional regulator [Chloroflexales bacterium]
MTAPTEDRRIQRTRSALRSALISLIMERGYEAITIQEIIDRANVGRSTFYAHYLDKHQLLLANLAELRAMLTESQRATVQTRGGLAQGRFAFSLGMLDHAGSHVPLYRAMVGKQSGVILQREIEHILADLVRAELADSTKPDSRAAIPQEVLVQYVVSAFLGLLVWWIEAGMPCAAAEVDRMFQALTTPGVQAALSASGARR